MAGISILRKLLLKEAVKKSAPHSGIMSIGSDVRKMVDRQVNKMLESAKRQGVDFDKYTEQEIKYILELNKPKPPKVYSNEEAYEILNRFANRNKRGEVIKADFGKPFAEEVVTVERVITDIKKLDPIESMKESNKVLKGEGRYKSLSKADREKIVNDESVTDHIFERNIEPEDLAQGGRTGLSYLLAEDTNERMPMWLGGGLMAGKGQLRKLLEYMAKGASHGKTGSEILQMVNPKQFNKMLNDPATMGKVTAEAPEGIPGLVKEYIKKMNKERANMVGDFIGTGRKMKKADDDIINYKITVIEDMVSKGIDRKTAERMAEMLATTMEQQVGKKAIPKITGQGLLEMENIQKNLLTKDRPLNAEGGRIGSKGAGPAILDITPDDLDYLSPEEITHLIKLIRAGEIPQYAGGGRVPFKLGGIDKMRRGFLKMMGAGAAGIGAAKTGLFGLLKGSKSAAKEVTQVPIKNIEGMPAWFKPLVNKVIKEGEPADSWAMGQKSVVHKTKLPESDTTIVVEQQLDTGDVIVDIGMGKHGWADGKYGQPTRLHYKAKEFIEPDIDDAGKVKSKGQEVPEEFNVEEAEFTGGHPENVKFEESTIEKFGEHESDFREVEKFAIGKNTVTGQFGTFKDKPAYKRNISSLQKQNEDLADKFSNMPEPDDYASGGVAKMLGE